MRRGAIVRGKVLIGSSEKAMAGLTSLQWIKLDKEAYVRPRSQERPFRRMIE